MKKYPRVLMIAICAFILTGVGAGCAPGAGSADSALTYARRIENRDLKLHFLLERAGGFLKRGKYEDTLSVARYVLENIDEDNQRARSLIQKAQNSISADVRDTAVEIERGVKEPGRDEPQNVIPVRRPI